MILRTGWLLAAVAAFSLCGCASKAGAGDGAAGNSSSALQTTKVTITSGKQAHVFSVEIAATKAEQEKGLMFRTDIGPDQGMLFYPYPPDGTAARVATFWMKNTPTSLDIVFIRPDGTIARIADNTVPYSEAPVPSGEPVGAVLELVGGRTAELGIEPGDKVDWPGRVPNK